MTFRWSGSEEPFLDTPSAAYCGAVTVGRFGGATAVGAYKNEDAALVWTTPEGNATFAALLDAHGSSESADLVLNRIAEMEAEIVPLLNDSSGPSVLRDVSERVLAHLSADDFRHACARVRGEAALLLCAQHGAYLWWLSIGDIPVYVLHPEFAHLGQFALNQRLFYEWVGQVNMFALPVPCYATGVRQLRTGRNLILLTTDGLLECGTRFFENPRTLFDHFTRTQTVEAAVAAALSHVQAEQGRDSATLIAWDVSVPPSNEISQPSA